MKYQLYYFSSNKIKNYHLQAAAEYRKRLSLYCKVACSQVKKEKEWKKLWMANENNYLILPGPDSVTSETFSRMLGEWEMEGRGKMTFFIPHVTELEEWVDDCLGQEPDIRILNLSDFTLEPQLLHVLLLEQIYRGYRIRNNHPYHK